MTTRKKKSDLKSAHGVNDMSDNGRVSNGQAALGFGAMGFSAMVLVGILWMVSLPAMRPAEVDPSGLTNSAVVVYQTRGHGSGVVVGKDRVLTARHVACHFGDANDPLLVITADGDAPRRVIGTIVDPNVDAAILLLDPNTPFDANEPPAEVDRVPLGVGDVVTVVGTPLDRENLKLCVLRGYVVKVNVSPGLPGALNLDIIDAHAAPGCSGGPVFDSKGRVRGILLCGVGGILGGSLPTREFDGLLRD
jgi:S1-C subfamily serine protease